MRLRPVRLALALVVLATSPALGWNNGQPGNANTDTAAACSSNPPYATHDWVAEQALMLLPQAEHDWLMPFTFGAADFQSFFVLDSLVRRSAYTAVKRISRVTARGEGAILSPAQMESLWSTKPQNYVDSIGHSLNLGVNELADVLHSFFLNVVSEDD